MAGVVVAAEAEGVDTEALAGVVEGVTAAGEDPVAPEDEAQETVEGSAEPLALAATVEEAEGDRGTCSCTFLAVSSAAARRWISEMETGAGEGVDFHGLWMLAEELLLGDGALIDADETFVEVGEVLSTCGALEAGEVEEDVAALPPSFVVVVDPVPAAVELTLSSFSVPVEAVVGVVGFWMALGCH